MTRRTTDTPARSRRSDPAGGDSHHGLGFSPAPAPADAVAGSLAALPLPQRAKYLLRAMRPVQWVKNVLVFAALIFDRHVFEPADMLRSVGAFIAFCAISSAIYLVNDLRDIEGDRVHPRKRMRPIAAGLVSVREATVSAVVLALAALALAVAVRPEFAGVIALYFALMLGYNGGLKHIVILDVCIIAAGFVLRAAGGAVAIDVPISPWLYICTALLALFIGFGKRRGEIATLAEDAASHRANLDDYTLPMLDQMIGITAASTVMAYALYTFDASTVPDNHTLMLTIPFVVYAIFRYLYLIHRSDLSGSPEVLLFRDPTLLIAILGWGFSSLLILYLSA